MGDSYTPVVQSLLDAIMNGMLKVSEGLVPLGTKLWFWLSVISICWYGIKVILESGVIVDVLGEFMRTFFMVAIAWGMLQDGWYVLILKDFIGGFADEATTIISSQLGLGGSVAESLVNGMSRLIGFASEAGNGIYDQIGHPDGVWDFLLAYWSNNITLMFLIAAMIVIFLAACVYFAIGIVSIILTSLALGLAPLFIPFLVWDYTRKWLDGFITFVISANLYKVVGTLMIGVTSIILDHMLSVINTTASNGEYGPQTLAAIFTAGFSSVILYLMWHVPSIVHGIMNGNASVRMGMPRQRSSGSTSASPAKGGGAPGTPKGGGGKPGSPKGGGGNPGSTNGGGGNPGAPKNGGGNPAAPKSGGAS